MFKQKVKREMDRPLFSILHPSARPEKWSAVYDAWMQAAVNRDDVEYVLCVDERWGFDKEQYSMWITARGDRDVLVWNTGRRCYVDAVNAAAKASTGCILIVIADDQFPCEAWDRKIGDLIGKGNWTEDHVVDVSTGTPKEHERGIMVMPILSRAWYERMGHVFYPEYESMFADNDFCEHARQDGVVIDARHLMFPHKHPIVDSSIEWDEQYNAQNRHEAYQLGREILERRRAVRFDGIQRKEYGPISSHSESVNLTRECVIAVCLPGESFSHHWVSAWTVLFTHLLQRGFSVQPCFYFTSNVYFTRQALANMVKEGKPPASYVLWLDDDNILTPANFDLLWSDLQGLPQADVVAGWTWIQNDSDLAECHVSAGKYSEDGKTVTFIPRAEIERLRELGQVAEVEWTGFPAVLMRAGIIEKAAEQSRLRSGVANPFQPIPAPNSIWGFCGEDIAFCVNVKDAGGKIFVDARCFVPHLKLRAIVPPPVAEKAKEVDAPVDWPVLVEK